MRWQHYTVIGVVSVLVLAVVAFGIHWQQEYRAAKPPAYNIILVVSDQQAFHLREAEGYHLHGHEELQRRGVTFTNHYTAAAMCSPSRAAFLTGTPPQVNRVSDQMGYPFIPTLDPTRPNMGSVLKSLGYRTAYFGKFEMDKSVLTNKTPQITTTAIQAYGFDEFNPDGDTSGAPRQGYENDPYYVAEAIRWLHGNAASNNQKPFFMVVSLLNPHDIMYADANLPGKTALQQAMAPTIFPAPANLMYDKTWHFSLPSTLQESLTAKGMPSALQEYQKGWSGFFGFIPTDQPAMWTRYYNYYLNAIRDDDRNLQALTQTLTDMGLWKNTIVIFTADHGDMGGTHGGLRGKGPMAYEENVHVPLIIAHPEAVQGTRCHALTSHLDLLPTIIGLTKQKSAVSAQLAGHDFSGLLMNPEHAGINELRPAILFNYVGLSTVDSQFLINAMKTDFAHAQTFPSLKEINRNKRGFVTAIFDGRYKFARFYAPNVFNTPTTIDELYKNNDVQLFDLQMDPEEAHNLALLPEQNKELILRLNGLMNEMVAREVGNNMTSAFLPS